MIKQVIKFGAEWCPGCRAIAPMYHELQNEYEGVIELDEVDVDVDAETPTKYGITSLPTLVFLVDGQVKGLHKGALTKTALKQKIESYLG